ncbi:hairy-related 3 [Eucyclogobius newberryi]|uniref:hairy-related 3 n=1 Tax=Eucyclogobius newberryi TaxID=166745 RepID=UPI003B5B6F99
MVATTDCDRPRAMSSRNKVSKPLMEKKRRARINQSLDQLKSLLESHYSSTIRKRKMEKADILELTVRHLKHLQRRLKFSHAAPESEYRTGFRSCVSNVNHYLLTADHVSSSDRWQLSQLSSRLLSARRPEEGCSTMDSGIHAQLTRSLVPSPTPGSEESNTGTREAHSPASVRGLTRRDGHSCSGAITAPTTRKNTNIQSSKLHREALNDQLNVWRPW